MEGRGAAVSGNAPADPTEGCTLCGADWGEHHAVVDGIDRIFCCGACARFYLLAIEETKRRTGWPKVDRLYLESVRGDEADGWARAGDRRISIYVRGTPDGTQLLEYRRTDAA